MKRTEVVRRCAILLVVLGLAAVCAGCGADAGGRADEGNGALAPDVSAPVVDDTVVAEGRIVPLRVVDVGVGVSGVVSEVLVGEGDDVSAGEVILRLDDAVQRASLAQAEAGRDAARATLKELEVGPRPQEVAASEAAVRAAKAGLDLAQAEAERARLASGPAAGQVAVAQAALADLAAGPNQAERDIAAMQVEMARNELWAAQGYRDGVKGAEKRGHAAAHDVDQAEAAIGMADVAHRIAQAQRSELEAGPRPSALSGAQAAVNAAEAQVVLAQAGVPVAKAAVGQAQAAVSRAEAQAALSLAGAADERIEAAQAGVTQAEAQVAAAEALLARHTVRAPIGGRLAALNVDVGEAVAPLAPVAQVADITVWEIETEDLTELEVVHVEIGQRVRVHADALPGVELEGRVASISDNYADKRGDVTYSVRIGLETPDPRLRWGMTVELIF